MDPWVLLSLGITAIIIIIVIFILIALLINTVCYKIGFSVVDGKNEDWGSVFVTALICALVGWIPCLGCILSWYVIKSRHDLSWGKAILVWLIAAIIGIVISYLIWGILGYI